MSQGRFSHDSASDMTPPCGVRHDSAPGGTPVVSLTARDRQSMTAVPTRPLAMDRWTEPEPR